MNTEYQPVRPRFFSSVGRFFIFPQAFPVGLNFYTCRASRQGPDEESFALLEFLFRPRKVAGNIRPDPVHLVWTVKQFSASRRPNPIFPAPAGLSRRGRSSGIVPNTITSAALTRAATRGAYLLTMDRADWKPIAKAVE